MNGSIIDWIDGGVEYHTPWIRLSRDWQTAIEAALTREEFPVVVLARAAAHSPGWLATDSHLIDLTKRPPQRYELHSIADLTLKGGWLTQRLTFSHEGRTIKLPQGELAFWALVTHWPHLAQDTVVQQHELREASAQDLQPFDFGCLLSLEQERHGKYLTDRGFARYAKATVRVLTKRRRGDTNYFQLADCPHCGQGLRFRVNNGVPSLWDPLWNPFGNVGMVGESPTGDLFSPFKDDRPSFAAHKHKPWSEL